MREIEDRLGEVGRLDDTAHLDGAFVFDELADDVEKFGRELDMDTISICRQQG